MKTMCVTRYGSYECLVMSFRLTNALTTLYNLMNDVLFDYLDGFVVVYLNDVVICSQALKDHENHLRKVFQWLREHKLCVQLEKCEFEQEMITFLGHKINKGMNKMDEGKVKAIVEWTILNKVTKLWSFLKLKNYYRKFIKGYSK